MFYIFTAAAGKDRGMAKDGRDVEKMQQIDGRTRLCGLIGNPVEIGRASCRARVYLTV